MGRRRDGLPAWRKMFHLFAANREEFLRRYRQRSNVESAFSMIKRKFGDAVPSKTTTAMANEVLAKVVCHNVMCCIHTAHELRIDVRFGRGKAGGGRRRRTAVARPVPGGWVTPGRQSAVAS